MATFAEQLASALADLNAKKAAYDSAQALYNSLLAQSVPDGLDVSEFNGDVDWPTVKTSAGFAFVRSADGDYNDKLYTAARVAAIRAAGLPFGVYQFARVASDTNGQRDGRTEAAMAYYFARRQGWGVKGDLPLVYDFEAQSYAGQTAAKSAAHVLDALASGAKPLASVNVKDSRALRSSSEPGTSLCCAASSKYISPLPLPLLRA